MSRTIRFQRLVQSALVASLFAVFPVQAQQATGPMALKAMKVTMTDSERRIELPGRTSAYQVAEIRPQVSGIVTERLFKEGGWVDEGAQLYQIDPTPYIAAYDSAVADLKKAQANVRSFQAKVNRYDELIKINAVSRQDYDDLRTELINAKADIGIAEAAIAQAKVSVDYTKVYAPISGIIGKSSVTKGALVTSGQETALTRITQLDPIYVDLTQSSSELMRLRRQVPEYEKSQVALLLDGSEDPYEHLGTLQFFDVTVDQTTSSVQLRALFKNPDRLLLPGMFIRGQLIVKLTGTLLIPQYATTRQPDGSLSVWVVDEQQQAQPVSIKTNGSIKNQWMVTSGLKEGDVIIIEGLMRLKPGTPVNPVLPTDS